MEIQQKLAQFKKIFDPVLKKYLENKEKELAKISPQIKPLFFQIKKIAFRGKRLRAYLAWLGYVGFEGKDKQTILKAGVAIELYHLFCLIHDDIIDDARERRGVETINAKFGNDAAILAGDLVFSLAEEALQVLNEVSAYWQKLKEEVIVGQYLELSVLPIPPIQDRNRYDPGSSLGKEALLKIMELKTARYTVLRPLQIGAALAGAKRIDIKKLRNYALPAGIAFQIKDDLLDGEKVFSQKIANNLAVKAKKGLESVRMSKAEKEILRELADFMVERKS